MYFFSDINGYIGLYFLSPQHFPLASPPAVSPPFLQHPLEGAAFAGLHLHCPGFWHLQLSPHFSGVHLHSGKKSSSELQIIKKKTGFTEHKCCPGTLL